MKKRAKGIAFALLLLLAGNALAAERVVIYDVPYEAAASDDPSRLIEAIRNRAPEDVVKVDGGVVRIRHWPVYKGRGVELRIENPGKVRRNYREILTLLQRYLRAHRMANKREIIQTLEDLKGL